VGGRKEKRSFPSFRKVFVGRGGRAPATENPEEVKGSLDSQDGPTRGKRKKTSAPADNRGEERPYTVPLYTRRTILPISEGGEISKITGRSKIPFGAREKNRSEQIAGLPQGEKNHEL